MARLIFIAGTLLAVSSFVVSAQETSFASEQNYDTCDLELGEDACVPATCCHPTECVSREFAPNCTDVACTKECRPGTLDCGQGYCACSTQSGGGAKCSAVYYETTNVIITPPNETVTEPTLPPTLPAVDTCDLSVGDSDCVPATCCHPTECVRREFAPNCTDVACTLECRPGTLDCNQGYCACSAQSGGDARCTAVYPTMITEPSETGTEPTTWTQPPNPNQCDWKAEDNEDVCVPATCCHATACVNKAFAPNCTDVACTEECRPGTLDCGQGFCECSSEDGNGLCQVKWVSTVSETAEETTAPVLTTDATQTISDPPVTNPETTLDETTIPVGTTEPSATVTEPEPTAIPTTAVSTSRPPTGNDAPSTAAVTFGLVTITLFAVFGLSL